MTDPNQTKIRHTADAILAAACPLRLTAAAVLRAYADAEHHFGEGIRQPVDYGTGWEHDAVCVCGASWGEDGCTERERLLAVAAEIENAQAVDKAVDNERSTAGA
jgi:hypothetical protein